MQRLEVSGAVGLIYKSLGVKGLTRAPDFYETWRRKSLQTLLSSYEFRKTIGSLTVMLILPTLYFKLARFR